MLCLTIAIALPCLGACPNDGPSIREEWVEEVGGGPKRQLDAVKGSLDNSAQRLQERLEPVE
jgi:hypothetical protein